MRRRIPPKLLETRAIKEGISEHGCIDSSALKFFVNWKKQKRRTEFGFEFLREPLGDNAYPASSKLVRLWAMGAKRTSTSRHQLLRAFFEQLPAPLRSTVGIHPNDPSVERDCQIAVDAWAGAIKAKHAEKPRTAGEILGSVNRGLRLLQAAEYFPKVALPGKVPNSHRASSTRPTLAEQIRVSHAERSTQLGDVIDAMLDALVDPADRAAGKSELNALAGQLKGDLPTSPEGLLAALRELQHKCLSTVTSLASAEFRRWQSQYEQRDRLLGLADEQLIEQLRLAFGNDKAGREWVQAFLGTYSRDELVGSALACFIRSYGGLAICEPKSKSLGFVSWFYEHVGGRTELDALLHATPSAVACAMLLTACETGANPAVLCELNLELGLKPHPDQPGAYVFESLKRRAGNKFVVSLLREQREDGQLPAIAALKLLSTALEPVRAALHTDSFFVFRFFDQASFANTSFLANQLRYLLRDAGLSNTHKFTPSAIRPCVLVIHSLSKSPDSLIERQLAGHAEDSTATSRYEFRLEQRIRLSAYARQYQEQMEELAQLVKTEGRGPTKQEADKPDDLWHRQIVDLDDDLILDAVLTIRCLERANNDLVQNRRAHWLHACEPELAWATVLVEKAKKSAVAHRVRFAEAEASKLLAAGFIHHLE